MKIIQIYPANNPVSTSKTKPVVLAGMPYVKYSKYNKNIGVISSYTEYPYNKDIIVLKASKNKEYYLEIKKFLLSLDNIPKIIEVHQDTKLAAFLGKTFKGKINIFLIKHSPNLYNRLYEKSLFIRLYYSKIFLKHIKYVFCVSDYVTKFFQSNYPKYSYKFKTLYNSYGHLKIDEINNNEKKEHIIMFVGKPIKIKGIFEFMKSLPSILNKYSKWKGEVIGAFFSVKEKYRRDLNNLVSDKEIADLIRNKKIIINENFTIDQVLKAMKKAKILVVPSIYKEEFGLIALEGHVAGCIVITSGRGGLSEISGNFAYYINEVDEKSIIEQIDYVINNLKEAENLAKLGQEHVLKKFDPRKLVKNIDDIRSKFLEG